MFYLYVLKSVSYNRHYIGITSNIETRLEKHNSGNVRSTKGYKPWELLHTESFSDKKSARIREIYLKKNYQARKNIVG